MRIYYLINRETLYPENFVSLLFYFGLLSYDDRGGLGIPNQTVRQLMYSYLRDGYRDVDVFLIEVKYMTRGEFSEEKMKELLADAQAQLVKYGGDEGMIRRCGRTTLKSLALVFSGWELKAAKECGQ